MDPISWVVGLLTDDAATSGIKGAARAVLGTPDEAALRDAFADAARLTAIETVGAERSKFVGDALDELWQYLDLRSCPAGGLLGELVSGTAAAVSRLWEIRADDGVTQAEDLGLDATPSELTDALVNNLIDTLGQKSTAGSTLGSLVGQLHVQRLERRLAQLTGDESVVTARSGLGAQARQVNAWITMATDPPELMVVNNSDSPIFDVRPTPALIAYDADGNEIARVGHSPLGFVRQVDPHSGWCWPLNHARGWGGTGTVRGHATLFFKDAAERSWHLSLDHLTPADDPWGY